MKIIISTLLLLASFAHASYPDFTQEEIQRHKVQAQKITQVASGCLDEIYKDHIQFYDKWKVSKYYGDRRTDYSTRAGRIAALKKYGAPESLVDQLVSTSCIGLTLKCMERGFKSVGSTDTWAKIRTYLYIDQKVSGTDLQAMLQKLGWTIAYWNPDPSQNAKWDAEDRSLNPLTSGRRWMPVWGGHASRFSEVMNKGTYYGVPVQDVRLLVGFKDQPPLGFDKYSFFIGSAHSGYHVFPGRLGEVIEAHSMRDLNSRENLEYSTFNPLGTGGGPRWTKSEHYRSGIIALPPNQ